MLVFASYDGQLPEVGFTLMAYSGAGMNIAWDETVRKPPFTTKARVIFEFLCLLLEQTLRSLEC